LGYGGAGDGFPGSESGGLGILLRAVGAGQAALAALALLLTEPPPVLERLLQLGLALTVQIGPARVGPLYSLL
jgi:hypothetical protein